MQRWWISYVVRLCTPFSVPVDMLASVEGKKLIRCLVKKGEVIAVSLKAALVVKVDGLAVVVVIMKRKSLEALGKDARMPAFYT